MLLDKVQPIVIRHPFEGHQPLISAMHRDRAAQFKERLGWAVEVDGRGEERDEYDTEQSTYIICKGDKGEHLGSMRLLPLDLSTMLYDHFYDLVSEHRFDMRRTFECTRFCLAPSVSGRKAKDVAMSLFDKLEELAITDDVTSVVAIFEKQMLRVYSGLGVKPTILNEKSYNGEVIALGQWSLSDFGHRQALRN